MSHRRLGGVAAWESARRRLGGVAAWESAPITNCLGAVWRGSASADMQASMHGGVRNTFSGNRHAELSGPERAALSWIYVKKRLALWWYDWANVQFAP